MGIKEGRSGAGVMRRRTSRHALQPLAHLLWAQVRVVVGGAVDPPEHGHVLHHSSQEDENAKIDGGLWPAVWLN